jgi:DNA polymerase-3 subunit beta
MNIQISTNILLPILQSSTSVLDRKHNQPILSNLLLQLENNQLSITATDLELELTSKLQIDANEKSELAIPARKLLDICRTLPLGSKLKIVKHENQVKITSGKSRFMLSTLPAKDFPRMNDQDNKEILEIDRVSLINLFNNTNFAMASQDVRYYLNGLLVEITENSITTVATDGHRLAVADVEFPNKISSEVSMIIPRKGVLELLKLLAGSDEKNIRLSIGNNGIGAIVGTQVMKIKLLEGNFPDYKRVIPKESNNFMLADRDELKSVPTRTSILSNEKFRGIRLTLNKNLVKAIAHNPEKEEAEEDLEVKYTGDDLEVGFNVAYLLDVLGILKCEIVRLDVTDANSSCLITDPEQSNAKYVVMPMRL